MLAEIQSEDLASRSRAAWAGEVEAIGIRG
jgi:hypothetical protein